MDAAKGNGLGAANDRSAKIYPKGNFDFSDSARPSQPGESIHDQFEAAIDLLRCQPMVGLALRREAYPFEPDGFLVGDDEGTVLAIQSLEDHEACYYFLKWLTQSRNYSNAQRVIWERRNRLVLVRGGMQ